MGCFKVALKAFLKAGLRVSYPLFKAFLKGKDRSSSVPAVSRVVLKAFLRPPFPFKRRHVWSGTPFKDHQEHLNPPRSFVGPKSV